MKTSGHIAMYLQHAFHNRAATAALLGLCLFAGACDDPAPATGTAASSDNNAEITYPHADSIDALSLDVYADGDRIHVLTAGKVPGADAVQLIYTRSQDGGRSWSKPLLVPQAADEKLYLTGHGGHPPQIAASGDQIVVMWAIHGDGWRGSGPLVARYSDDGGRSWRSGDRPVDRGVTAGQNFHDLVADGNGKFHAVWLDGRTGEQGLYYARSSDGGQHWSDNEMLDKLTCQCCRNTLAAGSSGTIYSLYRDLDPRDMALTRSDDEGRHWQRRSTVGHFNWQFDGCPHTGGGLAVADEQLYASVWTGAQDRVGAYLLHSADNGRTWSSPQRLGNARARHTDLASNADGRLLAVWDASDDSALAIHMAITDDAGQSWLVKKAVRKSRQMLAHPRAVATDSGFAAFWLETRSDGSTVWASLPLLSAKLTAQRP